MEDSRALSEHAQHQMLEKKLGEQAKIVPRNLKGPPVAARPPSVLVAKEKGHPKPVAPRRKPVLRPRPTGTPVPRPRSIPAQQPGADSNSNLGGVAVSHQNSKSDSNSVNKTSNSSHKTESNSCTEIARELKQRHLKPVLEEIANCKFAELECAKETVLKEYDEEATARTRRSEGRTTVGHEHKHTSF
ncbi:hypothetical protein BSL78_07051 [Apostichopus japonicus]|uniref:Uncharacterized protein n=1 Tax=Stichopus japonicus TaxID=307972 RepID=A0A2G8L6Z5_STIJA|nr:hypothetical protein BSL78_07051 [Apostichopus japonicus]